jgi:hypothetical protein
MSAVQNTFTIRGLGKDYHLGKMVVRALMNIDVIGGFIACGSATMPDSDHIHCFECSYPEWGTHLARAIDAEPALNIL